MGIGRDLAEKFWIDVKTLGEDDAGLELVMDTIDSMLKNEHWDALATLLKAYEPRGFITAVTITVLSSVYTQRESVAYYDEFKALVREFLVEDRGEEQADELLSGL
jgi:hypothetical protein